MDTNFSFRLPKKLHLCRLCLLHKDSFVNIHEPNITHGFAIAVEISDLLQLNVFPGDGLPDAICFDCLFDLSRFKRFKKISHEAEITLKYILSHNEVNLNTSIQTALMVMKEENLNEFVFQDNNIVSPIENTMLETNFFSTSVNEHIQIHEEEICGSQNPAVSGGAEAETTINRTQIIPGDKAKQSKLTKNTLEKSNSIPVEGSQPLRKPENLQKCIKVENVDPSCAAGKDISENSLVADMIKENEGKKGVGDDQHTVSARELISFNSQNHYKCSDCIAVFSDDYSFRSHISSGLCTSSYSCSVCNESFLSSVCLMEHHITYHTPVRSNDLFQKEFTQENHELVGVPNYLENQSSPLKIDEIYQKSYPKKVIQAPISEDACQKNHNQDYNVSSHSLTLIMKRGFVCDKCGSCFKKKIIFEHHLMKYHSQKLSFNCGICCKTFLTKGGLKEHLVVHSTERPFMCDICGSAFKLRKKLLRHLRTCHSEKKSSHSFIPI